MLRWLYKTDKTNRDDIKHWRSREKFVEHLRLLYPQLSNAADKSFLDMIKEIPFSVERHRGWFYLFYTANAAYPQTFR